MLKRTINYFMNIVVILLHITKDTINTSIKGMEIINDCPIFNLV